MTHNVIPRSELKIKQHLRITQLLKECKENVFEWFMLYFTSKYFQSFLHVSIIAVRGMTLKGRRVRSEILSRSLPATHAAHPGWTGWPSRLFPCPTTPLNRTTTAPPVRPTTPVAWMRCLTAANAYPTCPLITRITAPPPSVWPPCTVPCWANALRRTFTPTHEPSALTSDPHRHGSGQRDRYHTMDQVSTDHL